MNIKRQYIINNLSYITKETITPTHIIVHSLGVAQPDVQKVFNGFNRKDNKTSVHALVGVEEVLQIMPWGIRAWGCGGSGNSKAIQFEICEPAGHTYQPNSATMVGYNVKANKEYFDTIYKNAVELAAYLCVMHNIPTKNIIDHSEAYAKGWASNHGDVKHWFSKHSITMDTFRADVQALLVTPTPVRSVVPKSSKEDIRWAQEKLNRVLPKTKGFLPLAEDGIYGNKTRIAVLMYWELIGWNKTGEGTGWTIGKKTIDVLEKL